MTFYALLCKKQHLYDLSISAGPLLPTAPLGSTRCFSGKKLPPEFSFQEFSFPFLPLQEGPPFPSFSTHHLTLLHSPSLPSHLHCLLPPALAPNTPLKLQLIIPLMTKDALTARPSGLFSGPVVFNLNLLTIIHPTHFFIHSCAGPCKYKEALFSFLRLWLLQTLLHSLLSVFPPFQAFSQLTLLYLAVKYKC